MPMRASVSGRKRTSIFRTGKITQGYMRLTQVAITSAGDIRRSVQGELSFKDGERSPPGGTGIVFIHVC